LRAMQQNDLDFFGHFTDLHQHGDDRRYTKHDPDFFPGSRLRVESSTTFLSTSLRAEWG
jgi:hypothetical protein